MKLKYFVLLILILTTQARAQIEDEGGHSGNGGNAIVCFNNPAIVKAILAKPEARRVIPNSALDFITSIESLDLFESKSHGRGWDAGNSPVALFSSSASESNAAFLERVAKRVEKVIPGLAENLRVSIQEFKSKIYYLELNQGTSGVTQVYDVGFLPYQIDRNRCIMSTLINQSGFDESLQMTVDRRLFEHKKHGVLSRKSLMLHEAIYLWGRKSGHDDSKITRMVVGLLMKEKFSRDEMIKMLTDFECESKRCGYFEDRIPESESLVQEAVKRIRAPIDGHSIHEYLADLTLGVNSAYEKAPTVGASTYYDNYGRQRVAMEHQDYSESENLESSGKAKVESCQNLLKAETPFLVNQVSLGILQKIQQVTNGRCSHTLETFKLKFSRWINRYVAGGESHEDEMIRCPNLEI